MKTHRLFHFSGACAFAAVLSAASCNAAAVLLADMSLGGTQETAQWESGFLSSGNPSGAASAGAGSAAPLSPGFRSTSSFYSFMGNFGMTATTSIQAAAGFTDIQNVVFQRVSMSNPDFTTLENLAFDGTGGPAAAAGGPWLSYFDSSGNLLGKVAPTMVSVVAGDTGLTVGGFTGDIYSFAYQWDLSGVTEDVFEVTINAPILIHSATIEAQIDIGGNYVQVIPEPTGLTLGCFGFCGLLIRRRR